MSDRIAPEKDSWLRNRNELKISENGILWPKPSESKGKLKVQLKSINEKLALKSIMIVLRRSRFSA